MTHPTAQPALFAPAPETRNECLFSFCRRYRYILSRWLGAGSPPPPERFRSVCLWLMANPSIADETRLDPTLTRCAAFTRAWGYDEMRVVNVRAFVATDPMHVPPDPEAIGPGNFDVIMEQALYSSLLVCGWGKLGGALAWDLLDQVQRVATPHALRLNQDGSPAHPLYLPASLRPFAFRRTTP